MNRKTVNSVAAWIAAEADDYERGQPLPGEQPGHRREMARQYREAAQTLWDSVWFVPPSPAERLVKLLGFR